MTFVSIISPSRFFASIFNILANIGHRTINVCAGIGRFSMFFANICYNCTGKLYVRNLFTQFIDIFFFSIMLISVTGFFSGAVLSLQSYNGLERFGATNSIPAIVALSLARELGPALTALMIVSRVGSRIGAEIGGMSITSQIIAMRFLGVNPIKFLIIPRVLATIIAMPILSFLFTITGSLGGYIVCTYLFHFEGTEVIKSALDILNTFDVVSGLIKATMFGLIISSIPSYLGYTTIDGATGVGKTTTNAVVLSSMLILLFNYILTSLMFH
ncbi:MAG: ABC transporter permease [Alphaproteobacteria bacterium]|nr:ABC transporter permease [Rickettsiales bacterium]